MSISQQSMNEANRREHTMRKYFLLTLVIAISLPLCAQQPATQSAPPAKTPAQQLLADAASREQLMEMFDVLEVTQQMNSMVETMEKTMRQAAPVSNLSDQQKTELAKLDKELYVKVMNSDLMSNMVEAMIPIYQRHFTHADVAAIINFYSSPVGQKLLHEQPQILQELMPTLMTQTQQQMQTIVKGMNYTERMQQILDSGHTESKVSPK
jgi:hypothetical protein